jgi:hypothetical protein
MKKARVETCLCIGPPHGILRDANGTCHFTRHGVYLKWQLVATSSKLTLFRNRRLLTDQIIKLCRTDPNLGGIRWWYLCPDCGGRVAYLYLPQTAHHFSRLFGFTEVRARKRLRNLFARLAGYRSARRLFFP